MPTYKLTYFDFRGLAEPIRFILTYMGVDFVDNRFKPEEWSKIKPTTPFGKVPMLEIDGKVICQSAAICRYLAKQAGLAGKNDWESLQIDMTIDSFQDFRTEIAKIFSLAPSEKEVALKKIEDEVVPLYMGRIDEQIKKNGGFLCNGALSWGDFFITALIDTLCKILNQDFLIEKYPNIAALKQKVFEMPKIKAWIAKRPETEY